MNDSTARIRAELDAAIQTQSDWSRLDLGQYENIHVAIMSEPFLSYVFDGKKTIESRFSLNKIAPYGKVKPSDIVFMKAGSIVGCFTVSWVKMFNLSEYPITEIANEYGIQICGDDAFWKHKSAKRYVTLMGIQNVQLLTPVKITKLDRRAWVTLRHDVGSSQRQIL